MKEKYWAIGNPIQALSFVGWWYNVFSHNLMFETDIFELHTDTSIRVSDKMYTHQYFNKFIQCYTNTKER